MTPTTIPTNNLSFPSTYTTQGSVPPSLHPQSLRLSHFPSRAPTQVRQEVSSCGSRNSSYQNGVFIHLYTNVHSYFLKICKKLWVLLPHGLLMLPHGIFRTIVGPLDLYQANGLVPEHFDFPSRMHTGSTQSPLHAPPGSQSNQSHG
jgi:hypothetical protein